MQDDMRKAYTQWCRDVLFAEDIVKASALLQQALNAHLLAIYSRLGFKNHLRAPTSPQELSGKLGYVESAHITLDAVLERLSSRYAFVARTLVGNAVKYHHVNNVPNHAGSLEQIREKVSELGEEYLTTLEFLQFGDDHFEYALKDDPDFLDRILSGREPEWEDLWFRATNIDPLQNVHGVMGAVAIDGMFDAGDILEIGGGTGSGIRNLFRHLGAKNELDRIHKYTFTDISQKFIMSTRQEIRKAYPDVNTDWRFADLNIPLQQQKIEKESVDLIYAVNAAHVAKDIVAFLKSARDTLRPGGRVLFSERIRLTPTDMAPRELTLNLSIYHRTAAIRNPDYRPMHCYLSPDNWIRVLKLAGFREAEFCPDLDKLEEGFPDQYAAIVTAVK
ncbi:MAG: class I SAM-dependent methyltransferase [Gammaproteobacteria bacterium]|nr:class I SAM-dependent methyltransferase [Gammaproteobacteria bacterium]